MLKQRKSNRILVDWLSFSFTRDDCFIGSSQELAQDVVSRFGILIDSSFEVIPGMYGYQDRFYCNGISIHYNHSSRGSIWVEMSGQGCRYFETISDVSFPDVFQTLLSDCDFTINRLDIAYDDFEGLLDLDVLLDHAMKKSYTSKWRSYQIIFSDKGHSLVHGSQKSDIYLRIYDKAAEQKLSDMHWVRVEIQMRDDNARGFMRAYVITPDIGYIFSAVLNNYLKYRVESSDSNKARWPVLPMWFKFLDNAESIRILASPGFDYTEDKLNNYVENMAGHAIQTYVRLNGLKAFQQNVLDRFYRPNFKYRRLIANARERRLSKIHSPKIRRKFYARNLKSV